MRVVRGLAFIFDTEIRGNYRVVAARGWFRGEGISVGPFGDATCTNCVIGDNLPTVVGDIDDWPPAGFPDLKFGTVLLNGGTRDTDVRVFRHSRARVLGVSQLSGIRSFFVDQNSFLEIGGPSDFSGFGSVADKSQLLITTNATQLGNESINLRFDSLLLVQNGGGVGAINLNTFSNAVIDGDGSSDGINCSGGSEALCYDLPACGDAMCEPPPP